MAQTVAAAINKPVWANKPIWVDLSSSDPAGSREFYSKVFGWQVEINADPQYGGYGVALVGGQRVAGIGPKMMPEAPTAWSVYIGTLDVDELAKKVQAAGGKIIAPPMSVGDQGRMAVFGDPSGAFISAWQPISMAGFADGAPNTFAWAELNARGVEKAISFYSAAFGWTATTIPMGEGQPPYTRFTLRDGMVAGAMEMNPMVPASVPSYWMVYFAVADVEASFRKAMAAGAREMLAPQDFPGGRFAILSDPQGATFGLQQLTAR
jgi:predicted enzyme related to lactoylglutathione lyase